jgi:hypothetical protein
MINCTSLISNPLAATFVATKVRNLPDLNPERVTCRYHTLEISKEKERKKEIDREGKFLHGVSSHMVKSLTILMQKYVYQVAFFP